MKVRNIKYYIKEAFKSLLRNRLMAAASILTVSSCIFILIFSYCIAVNIDHILMQSQNSVGLSAFIEDELSADMVNELRKDILAIQHVQEVTYISADQGLEQFSEDLGKDSILLEGLRDDNPLPRSFTVMLDDNNYLGDVIKELNNMSASGIYHVRHAKESMDVLIAINNVIRIISAVIILALGLISIVIIMNTIKLTVNNRRNEINIMKYVGATDWFIRWPFVIEGVMIGLLGAAIPLSVSSFSYSRIIDTINRGLPMIEQLVSFKHGYEIFTLLTPITLASGMVIGSIGSITCIHKHLRV